MLTRSLVAFAASSLMFACSMAPAPAEAGNATGASTNAGNSGDKSTTSTGNSQTSTSTATAGHALDGTWDVTSLGDGPLGASQIVANGGNFTGTFVGGDEGTTDSDGVCTITKDRATFTVTITGDTMTGTFTTDLEMSGDPDSCESDSGTTNVTGTRAASAKNATGQTSAEGEWVITPDSNSNTAPFAVSVAGLAAQIWATAQHDDKQFDVSVSNGSASTDNPDFTFAARKR